MTFLSKKLKRKFPIFSKKINGHPLLYLDSAATTQKPKNVIDTLTRFYLHEYGTVHRAIYSLSLEATEKYDAAREAVRDFIHAKHVEEIVFTRGTTDSINLVALSFGKRLEPGDEILVSEAEHHSNLVPWQMLAKERGIKLIFIPINDKGEIVLDEYKRRLTPQTKLVSIAHIFNTTGVVNPVKEMIQLAHEVGAKVMIDGAQAIAHTPVDVQDLHADFYAFSGHKAYGPTGVGVLYGEREILKQLTPIQGGGDMVERATLEETTYRQIPLCFEAGTPMIAEVIAFKEAIAFLKEVGIQNIQRHEQKLLEMMTVELQKIPGLKIYGTSPNKGAIISFLQEGIHHLDIGTLLDLKGVAVRSGQHCSHPSMDRFGIEGTVRVSFGLYNTVEDVKRFVALLLETISYLQRK